SLWKSRVDGATSGASLPPSSNSEFATSEGISPSIPSGPWDSLGDESPEGPGWDRQIWRNLNHAFASKGMAIEIVVPALWSEDILFQALFERLLTIIPEVCLSVQHGKAAHYIDMQHDAPHIEAPRSNRGAGIAGIQTHQ
ncbi:7343_t:CDS:2, partial [Acaulospora colombiana]